MLDSIVEFITQAASSSAFIFCFCNLIIVYILLDLKPTLSSSVQQENSEVTPSMGTNLQKQETNSKFLVQKDTELRAIQVSYVRQVEAEAEAEAKLIEVDIIETIGNDECFVEEVKKEDEEEEKEEKEEEDDDELRKRVEEFIEKVNKGWKEELLITSSLV
ncbi:hypothetical protein HN51_071502 [Arachis hypogaea]|uniref:uncharacterized protein LOC110262661 n=1 Tax=Arachis ipaensis TaxID=130454 RepID=UPI000A2B412B|nr:uncharacterized protein LOC110262661 [Arachis ipaensis]QHO14112.1 uncharacterized protein DS421_15g521350 [Arachis hypogaea]